MHPRLTRHHSHSQQNPRILSSAKTGRAQSRLSRPPHIMSCVSVGPTRPGLGTKRRGHRGAEMGTEGAERAMGESGGHFGPANETLRGQQ
jgi:hypothetical protein